ncbi:MFS transporter [Pseudoduganella danionis]|uniref:MFS transporter n=1 Tax=Pseudoduganella danionis TaxID=1890295 RepID=UPI0035B3044D
MVRGAAVRPQHPSPPLTAQERKVIIGSSLGTVFEWYDFYLYGALAPIIAKQFFVSDSTTSFIFALLAFAAGFLVRPFGALVFGRLGDLVGRKHTFLITIFIMGGSTFLVGLLPAYHAIGIAAPISLVILRVLQGLALGGEYGGAATYVAEHAPDGKRGLFTSWIQTTATLGLLLSLLVILGTRMATGEAEFAHWGWRVPFLVSVILLGISVWIRMSMGESPMFARMKAEGRGSSAPIQEAFGRWSNLRLAIIALFGLTMGQAAVWYTGQFYALFFMTQTLKIDGATANLMSAMSLALATPFFVVFGKLSDRYGRKWIILSGCVLAAASYFPLFGALTHYGNPALEAALEKAPVTLIADPASCHFQFSPSNTIRYPSSCDIAASLLSNASVAYAHEDAPAGSVARIRIGTTELESFNASMTASGVDFDLPSKLAEAQLKKALAVSIKAAGYPSRADESQIHKPMVVAILFVLVLYVTMVYGPIAAMLVEMFPTRIRYTAMSLPYHLGNGWFGGLLPTVSFALVAYKGDIYYGLWYPIAIALLTAVVGTLFLRETRGPGQKHKAAQGGLEE